MSVSSTTREYLTLRILELKRDVSLMSLENGAALLIEKARIEECKNALTVLNGGKVPAFDKEVPNAK